MQNKVQYIYLDSQLTEIGCEKCEGREEEDKLDCGEERLACTSSLHHDIHHHRRAVEASTAVLEGDLVGVSILSSATKAPAARGSWDFVGEEFGGAEAVPEVGVGSTTRPSAATTGGGAAGRSFRERWWCGVAQRGNFTWVRYMPGWSSGDRNHTILDLIEPDGALGMPSGIYGMTGVAGEVTWSNLQYGQ